MIEESKEETEDVTEITIGDEFNPDDTTMLFRPKTENLTWQIRYLQRNRYNNRRGISYQSVENVKYSFVDGKT